MGRGTDKWMVVVTMALPLFLIAADINGVTVALPAMGDDLDASTTSLQWVLNAYLLAFASFLLPMGRFGDIFGRRLVLMGGLVVFGLASLIPVVAPSEEVLILGRALQGVGAAMLFATSLSLVSGAFPPEERAKGIGIWSGLGVSGAAIGPLLGGALTDTLGWRWFFFINLPIALAALVMTLRFVSESKDPGASRRVDLAGFATVTLAFWRSSSRSSGSTRARSHRPTSSSRSPWGSCCWSPSAPSSCGSASRSSICGSFAASTS